MEKIKDIKFLGRTIKNVPVIEVNSFDKDSLISEVIDNIYLLLSKSSIEEVIDYNSLKSS